MIPPEASDIQESVTFAHAERIVPGELNQLSEFHQDKSRQPSTTQPRSRLHDYNRPFATGT